MGPGVVCMRQNSGDLVWISIEFFEFNFKDFFFFQLGWFFWDLGLVSLAGIQSHRKFF